MLATNLKIALVILGTVAAYTLLANMIPQVESDVPRQVEISEDMTTAELVAIGEEIFRGGGGCMACHDAGQRAPALLSDVGGQGPIGARCGQRVPDASCRDYIYQSLTEPNAFLVDDYPGIMPDVRRTLSGSQILAVIAFLQDQGGEVTVTVAEAAAAQEEGEEGGSSGEGGAAAGAVAVAAGADDPEAIIQEQCLICHSLGDQGADIAPAFDGIGGRRDTEYLRRKILDPGFAVTEGYEATAGIMPTTFGDQLTAAQLEAVVGYLADLR